MKRFAYIALFAVFLALPGLQTLFRFAREARLYGAELPPPPPHATLRAWWAGTLQREAAVWIDAHIGFRGHAVRTDNQIGLSLFREAWSSAADRPVMGLRGTVFGQAYLDAYNGRRATPDRELRARVADIARLCAALRARGIALVVACAPGKPGVYPEWMDPRRVLPAACRGEPDRERMIPMLEASGVPVLDGQRLFLEWKAESPHPLFPPQGIHWNRLGAGRFADALWQELGRITGRAWPRLAVREVAVAPRANSRDAERDVALMLNVWRLPETGIGHVRATFATTLPPDGYRPRVVFVGDSFCDLLCDVVLREGMSSGMEEFFYFAKRRRGADRHVEPLEAGELDWPGEIFSADAVVLEIADGQIAQAGYGFVTAALQRLGARAP